MTVQATWQTLTVKDLLGEKVTETAATVRETVSALSAIVDSVIAALELLITLSVADIDLIAAAVAALVQAIEAAIDLFISTSVGITYIAPTSYKSATNVQTMLTRLAASYDDKTDANRPISQSDSDWFLMWVAVGASASVKEVYEAIRTLCNLFGKPLPEIGLGESRSFYRIALGDPPQYPPKITRGEGQAPQWESARLADVQPFSAAVNALLNIRDAFARENDNLAQMRERILLLRQRLAQIQAQLDKIEEVSQRMIEVNAAISGLTLLAIYGQGNTATQQAEILKASQLPSYPYKNVRGKESAACFVLHFQAGSGTAIDALRTILGVEDAFKKFSTETATAADTQAQAVGQSVNETKTALENLRKPWGL